MKHRKSAGHLIRRKHSPKRNLSNVLNYVQSVKKIRLELDKEQTEDEEEMQEEQTEDIYINEEEEQDNMQDQEGEEHSRLEGQSRNVGADKEQEGQHDDEDVDYEDDDGVSSNEEDSDDEPCLMCGEHDRPGDETIDWINCTECQQWVHEACLPQGYCFDKEDDDFICPVCLTGQKY